MATATGEKELLQGLQTILEDDSTLSDVNTVVCAQAGYYGKTTDKVLPLLVISPTGKSPNTRGVVSLRDVWIEVTVYGYTRWFGEERGIFGDSTQPGVCELGGLIEEALIDNPPSLSAVTVVQCQYLGTQYPKFYDRNFESLNEVNVSFRYNLRH